MTISSTGAAPGIAEALSATKPATSERPDALGKDAFLALLVAQMKYQDPMSPSDGTQFIAQTAQFTMVEKLEELTAQNTELLAASRLLSASSMVGRHVSYLAADGTTSTGTVTSARLDSGAAVLTVGGTDVPITAVRSVDQAPTQPQTRSV